MKNVELYLSETPTPPCHFTNTNDIGSYFLTQANTDQLSLEGLKQRFNKKTCYVHRAVRLLPRPIPTKFIVTKKVYSLNEMVFLNLTPAKKIPSRNGVAPLANNFFALPPTTDIVYENIKPVLFVLRTMGCLPMSRYSSKTVFKLTSPVTMYSVILFGSLIAYVVYLMLHKVQILRSMEGKFEEAVIEYLFTVYLFPLMTVPLLWYETPKIGGVLNSWMEFEVAYKQLSGRPLSMKLYQKSVMIAILVPMVSIASVVVTHVSMVHFQLVQLVPYIFLGILTYMLGGYWYLMCELLSVCASTLAEDFQKALRHIGPASRVADYRALWLRLSKLARATGLAHCYTFTFASLYLFLIITLSVYGLLSQISDGFGTKDIGLALTALCSILLLFFICDGAHYAAHNVRTNFQKKLLMVELSWMNTDAQTEVYMFLRATEMNDSRISLGGFFDVDRNLFKSLLTTMVTYLVVLLQFQISIPDEQQRGISADEESVNSTADIFDTTATTLTTMLTTVLTKKKKKH